MPVPKSRRKTHKKAEVGRKIARITIALIHSWHHPSFHLFKSLLSSCRTLATKRRVGAVTDCFEDTSEDPSVILSVAVVPLVCLHHFGPYNRFFYFATGNHSVTFWWWWWGLWWWWQLWWWWWWRRWRRRWRWWWWWWWWCVLLWITGSFYVCCFLYMTYSVPQFSLNCQLLCPCRACIA